MSLMFLGTFLLLFLDRRWAIRWGPAGRGTPFRERFLKVSAGFKKALLQPHAGPGVLGGTHGIMCRLTLACTCLQCWTEAPETSVPVLALPPSHEASLGGHRSSHFPTD